MEIETMVRNNEWVKLIGEGIKVRIQDWFVDQNRNLTSRIVEIHKETEKAVYVTIGAIRGYEAVEEQRWIPKSALMVMVDEGEFVYEITNKKAIKYDRFGKKVA
jgi:hypothetical protein